jgi:hypothetical protein
VNCQEQQPISQYSGGAIAHERMLQRLCNYLCFVKVQVQEATVTATLAGATSQEATIDETPISCQQAAAVCELLRLGGTCTGVTVSAGRQTTSLTT